MGFRINNNITALTTQGNLNKSQLGMAKSIERLSSGLRINRGADDAAGLTISEKLRGQIRGLNRATVNAQDGISLIQTAEGALNEDAAMLNRLRELAIQSQDDALTSGDRLEIQKEVDQLVDEIDRVAQTTEFNTKKLLDGSASSLVSSDHKDLKAFQTGSSANVAGDYRVNVDLSTVGEKQVQKSAILTNSDTGNKAGLGTKLSDLSSMTDSSGNQILETPKTVTIRANGEKADISISADLTIEQFTDKIESAITSSVEDGGLGITGSTFGFDITKAQVVFESGINGVNGELSIAADESVLKALGMQITTEAENSAYRVSATSTGVSNPTTTSANTTTGSAGGVIEGLKLDFQLASEARIDGTVEAQEMISVPGVTSMDPAAGTPAFTANTDVIFQIHDTNANTSEQANGAGTVSAGITVRLTAGRSYTMNSISTIINTLVAGANNPSNSLAKIIERPSGAVENPDTSSNMKIPSFRASFDGYNLKITSGVTGSSGSISILANQAATDVLGLQSGKVLGTGGTSAVISGGTDISGGVTLAGTGVLRIRTFDGDFRTNAVGGNTTPQVTDDVTFQRGVAISATSIVETFNNQFSTDGLDIKASINSSGQLEFRSGETGGDAKISIAAVTTGVGSVTAGMTNLGLVSNQNSIGSGGSAAVFTGNTASSSATTGYVLNGGFRFKVTDAYGSSSGPIHFASESINGPSIPFVNPNYTDSMNYTNKSFSLSKEKIVSIMGASNLSSTDIDYSFDAAGRLDFTSRSVGEESRIVLSQVTATDSANSLASFGFSVNQATQGSGKTSFNLHVADNSLNFQIGANQKQAIQFGVINTSAEALGLKGLDITNVKSATRALGAIDTAVQIISSERSKLGSLQNRMTSTINNLTVTATNLQATESKIRDVDVAKETVDFTRNQIMIQAGTAQLAQAKGLNQNALQLLG
ncbi:MAG: hypothetical protein KC646_13070 [Candidatus Cloacimonetes bacterium]|nr:hypothetical protein [Candidatus Cloacimonadota bacterium]